MPDDDHHTGIPTRAIHEAYLDMQRALKRYRQATDNGTQAAIQDAHGDVQEAVLTFWEMLRPHVKHNDAINEYWDGELPPYPGTDGEAPDPEDGKAVLHIQQRYETTPLNTVVEDGEELEKLNTLSDWHDALGMNGNVRLTGVYVSDSAVNVQYQAYQLGMRQLDGWETEFRTTQAQLGGFLGSETTQETERQRVDMPKLKRAARELGEVAERLGALSEFDASTPRTEITDELIEDIDEWRKQTIE